MPRPPCARFARRAPGARRGDRDGPGSTARRIAFLVVVGLLVSAGLPGGSLAQGRPASSTDVVSTFTLTADQPAEQLAGKSFAVRWGLTAVASGDARMISPVVTVTVPKKHVTSVNPSPITSQAQGPTVTETGDSWVVAYQLGDITAGCALDIPMVIVTTPDAADRSVISVTAALADSSGNTLQANQGQPANLTLTTGEPFLHVCVEDAAAQCGDTGATGTPATAYGGRSDDGGATLSQNPDRLSSVVVHFTGDNYVTPLQFSEYGRRCFARVELGYTLPAGAVFDAAANPGWTLAADGQSVESSFATPWQTPRDCAFSERKILSGGPPAVATAVTLKFPGAPVGQPMTHSATWTGVPVDPEPGERAYTATTTGVLQLTSTWTSGDLPFSSMSGQLYPAATSVQGVDRASYEVELDNRAPDAGLSFTWSNYSALSAVQPDGEGALHPGDDPASRDATGLDPRLAFSAIAFGPYNENGPSAWPGPIEVWTCRDSQPAQLLTTVADWYAPESKYINFTDIADITCVEVRTADGTTMAPQSKIIWRLEAVFRDPTLDPLADGQSTVLSNAGYSQATWSDGLGAAHNVARGSVDLQPHVVLRTDVGTAGTGYGNGSPVVVGNTVEWTMGASDDNGRNIFNPIPLRDLTYVAILPVGLVYQPPPDNGSADPAQYMYAVPTVVDNYHDSGRQALSWKLGDSNVLNSTGFTTLVTGDAEAGLATTVAYITWSNADRYKPTAGPCVPADPSSAGGPSDPGPSSDPEAVGLSAQVLPPCQDPYDVNDNGDLTDTVTSAAAAVWFLPAREVGVGPPAKDGPDAANPSTQTGAWHAVLLVTALVALCLIAGAFFLIRRHRRPA